MRANWSSLVAAMGLFLAGLSAEAAVHHDLWVNLTPEAHRLEAKDRVLLSTPTTRVTFALHANLNPRVITPMGAVLTRVGEKTPSEVPTDFYEVTAPREFVEVTLEYQGEIFHPFSSPEEEYARGFSSTPGQIGPDGVYLSGSTEWAPRFGEETVTFTLITEMPPPWSSVSQGEEVADHTSGAKPNRTVWRSPEPQDEILLIGGIFIRYAREGSVRAEAFLRTPDDALATRYLDATVQYVKAYEDMLGAYPYRKFALVENYWETGYGMPSFTLLGPKIIRFPFILTSSYPHEILHNWWGNSVFVDYATGNWCEGLTAYLADHWIKEQASGQAAADYRRTTLQKYTDFVSGNNDFPLNEFRERHSASSEAVGYGKALMFYHMLRRKLGDDAFLRGLRTFYTQNKFQRAGFSDLEKAFQATGSNLNAEFSQWVRRPGAPELRVRSARAERAGSGFRLDLALEQIQGLEPFSLRVPLVIHLDGVNEAFQTHVKLEGRAGQWSFDLPAAPVRLEVDPEFDVFRRLDPRESPAVLSQLLGAKAFTIVIPAEGPLAEAYGRMARNWIVAAEGKTNLVRDTDLAELPSGETVWVLGWENRWAGEALARLRAHGVESSSEGIKVENTLFPSTGHGFVISGRNGSDGRSALGFVAGDSIGVVGGVDRKLPHYSKYSYLVFKGADAANVGKGIWTASDSPMSVPVMLDGAQPVNPNWRGQLISRKALSAARPATSQRLIRETVEVLASPAARGRELGSPELDQLAQWIAGRMQEAGLSGGAGSGEYFQKWSEDVGAPKGVKKLTNVIGVLPGADPTLRDELVVLGAHYDHLGLGWPDAREGNRGKIHLGADDNASGVAVLLEVARVLAHEAALGRGVSRTLVFVAFTGEEAGLLGSRHFAKGESRVKAMVNLDTVGSLLGKPLTILGVNSAAEWSELLSSAANAAGIPVQLIASDPGGSDQRSFLRHSVPAVQFFTGATANYHRPSDTADQLDYLGLTRVSELAAETLVLLANRSQPLTYQPEAEQPGPTEPTNPGRKAFLGTVPDFAFPGPGIRVSAVVQASPAERAGLRAGDVLLAMNDKEIGGLREYSELLKRLRPGDEIEIRYRRDEDVLSCAVVLIER